MKKLLNSSLVGFILEKVWKIEQKETVKGKYLDTYIILLLFTKCSWIIYLLKPTLVVVKKVPKAQSSCHFKVEVRRGCFLFFCVSILNIFIFSRWQWRSCWILVCHALCNGQEQLKSTEDIRVYFCIFLRLVDPIFN